MASADDVIEALRGTAVDVVDCSDRTGRRAARRLERILAEADRDLSRRLRAEVERFGDETVRFSGAQALVYQRQVRAALLAVRGRLAGLTAEQSGHAIAESLSHTAGIFEALERTFAGVVRPMRLREAATFDPLRRGAAASLLRTQATSVDRYGLAMIARFEETMAVGMAAGWTSGQMVDALTGHAGPSGLVSMRARVVAGNVVRTREDEIHEGLFRRYRSWAWRIVRTETSRAYNTARMDGIRSLRSDFPDVQKKILATFDARTAADSVAVHGQIRDVEAYFVDGAGRTYLQPPARPNDREVVIPWRPHYPEVASTAPLTRDEIAIADSLIGTPAMRGVPREVDVAGETSWARRARARANAERRAAGRPEIGAPEPPPRSAIFPDET